MTSTIAQSTSMGISLPGVLILAIAVGFLVYVFTGSGRLVAGVLFCGLLMLLAAGFFRVTGHGGPHRGRLVELAPQRQPIRAEELGPAAVTSLFDVSARGHSFVYVIDGSASMGRGGAGSPLEALKEPLKRSVTDLQRNHRFQMFFFDGVGTQTCVQTERKTQELVVSDNHHVVQALQCIDAWTTATGSENPERFLASDALYQALALQPDVLYFVTDGEGVRPSAKDLESLRKWNTGRTTVHVVQLTTDGKAENSPRWLSDLASQNRGKFRQVTLAPKLAEKPLSKTPEQVPPPANAQAARKKRPDWIDDSQKLDSKQAVQSAVPGAVQRAIVSSGFSKDEKNCRDNLDKRLLAATASYIDRVVERGAGQKLTHAEGVRERTLQYLTANVVLEWYDEEKHDADPVIGDGVERYALLSFNEQTADHFRQEWRMIVQERRMLTFAAGVGLLLAFVGVIFSYLKMDTATRGRCSGRLRFVAGIALLAIASGAAALVKAAMG